MSIEARADAALRVLSDPVVKEAIEAYKTAIIEQWAATPARDTEGREWVWRHFKVAEGFEEMLKGFVTAGKMEKIKTLNSNPVVDWFKKAA